jgi:hypothetical protein
VSAHVPSLAEFEALVARVAELERRLADASPEPSPFVSVVEPPATPAGHRLRLGDPGYPLQADVAYADGRITASELRGLQSLHRLVRRSIV